MNLCALVFALWHMNGIRLQRDVVIGWLVIGLVFVVSALAQQKQAELPKVVRKSNNALQASAINRVEAIYPPSALMTRAIGTIFVEVTIDESGSVTSARAQSGHPLLKAAAVDAARGWTFQPTVLQSKPVKVIGTLTFTFKLPEYVLRDRVIERVKQQAAMNPANAKLQYRLGRAYEDNDQLVEALKAYRHAVDLEPDYGNAQIAVGALSMRLNRYDEALDAYNEAALLNLRPEIKAVAYRAIGLIHFRRDEFAEAVEPFEKAIALAPQASMYFDLGLTFLKLGDEASAMDQYLLLKEVNSILAQQLLNQINKVR